MDFQLWFYFIILFLLCAILQSAKSQQAICREEVCGNVTIPSPFRIHRHYYSREKPFININGIDLELLGSLFQDTILIKNPVSYVNCDHKGEVGTLFFFSSDYNYFGSVGCGNLATIFSNEADPLGGCIQPKCGDGASESGYYIRISGNFTSNVVNMTAMYPPDKRCSSAFIFSRLYFREDYPLPIGIHIETTHVPATFSWNSTYCGNAGNLVGGCLQPSCRKSKETSSATGCPINIPRGLGSFSANMSESNDFDINNWTYVPTSLQWSTPISGLCHLRQGLNTTCSSDSQKSYFPTATKNTRNLTITIIGCGTSIGAMFLLLGTWLMYKVFKRKKDTMLKKKYFKRIGGLLLQQHLSSNRSTVEKVKLFNSMEIEKATDYYNENRILGQGGQGTVYKGMLTDGSIVAIKKSKMVEGKNFDEKKVKQFINEVIILSQVNHRNVVKLLGCCLEAEVPLLVYEFIPNGTLYNLIHSQNEESPLRWEMRLRIAIEIANAVFYLHSAAFVPIYHYDIKSSNILLDDKYKTKVSDFGTSRSIALEQTHLTTRVQGTFGYMDTEYFRSSQFIEKSDVYSFGVVLEVRALVSLFLLSMQGNSLFDILDSRVVNDGPEKEIIEVAKLAKRCLNLNGKKRPTMKRVAMELELIKASIEDNVIEESGDKESETDDIIESWDDIASYSINESFEIDSETVPLNTSF
ncbi:hypothetical protein ES288_A10G159900v1 [Gossypium darwinii]|uniref:Protein kinase domain-containing protein n=1 Tax=Gossypium darwinii TaxID=34276 RepID=A0A5D2F145_GOSDA|nr:hypothetical protein ES288_A10G159900v1 [Gossypium darwinii]